MTSSGEAVQVRPNSGRQNPSSLAGPPGPVPLIRRRPVLTIAMPATRATRAKLATYRSKRDFANTHEPSEEKSRQTYRPQLSDPETAASPRSRRPIIDRSPQITVLIHEITVQPQSQREFCNTILRKRLNCCVAAK